MDFKKETSKKFNHYQNYWTRNLNINVSNNDYKRILNEDNKYTYSANNYCHKS